MMKQRNNGIDIFRIMCCLGVLDYHIMDDVLGIDGGAKAIYFLASFCIPGFFLLSGYLLEGKAEITIDYCERKVIDIMEKLFCWTVFWSAIHFTLTGEIYDIWSQFTAGARAGGILPVAWFLFTWCVLMILALPLDRFMRKTPLIFAGITVAIMVLLALGFGQNIVEHKPQTLWFHLYLGYFMLGMILSKGLPWVKAHMNHHIFVVLLCLMFLVGLGIYAFNVKNAAAYLPPHQYYGKWYYTIWLLSFFCLVCMLHVGNHRLQTYLKKLAENTVVVYLGHLPVLLYITARHPLNTTGMALIFIGVFFIGFELAAEIFRKTPILRKLV